MKRHRRAVLIAGPTASGKSALALRIAAATDGVVVNVDSMQVYSVLHRLTARPGADELRRVPHRLYGHVHPSVRYSAGAWLDDVKSLIAEPEIAGRMLVFVGGTGLYFRALLGGLAEMPAVPAEIRQALQRELADKGAQALHERLCRLDPDTAAIVRPGDTQRILRALEVLEASGEPISAWHRRGGQPLVDPEETARYVIVPDRQRLAERIESRFRQMVRDGAVEEVRAIAALDLPGDLPAMKAIGLRELRQWDEGQLDLEEAVRRVVAATRQYARRQETWFRHQAGPEWKRIGMEETDRLAAISLDQRAGAS